MPVAQWTERDTATNATITATRAADTDDAHFITAAYCRFSDVSVAGVLTIKVGSTTVWDRPFTGSLSVEFPFPVQGLENTAVTASIGAGGLAVDGFVGLHGFTA